MLLLARKPNLEAEWWHTLVWLGPLPVCTPELSLLITLNLLMPWTKLRSRPTRTSWTLSSPSVRSCTWMGAISEFTESSPAGKNLGVLVGEKLAMPQQCAFAAQRADLSWLHQQRHSQQAEGGDFCPLPWPWETPPWLSHPALQPPKPEGCGPARAGPEQAPEKAGAPPSADRLSWGCSAQRRFWVDLVPPSSIQRELEKSFYTGQ